MDLFARQPKSINHTISIILFFSNTVLVLFCKFTNWNCSVYKN